MKTINLQSNRNRLIILLVIAGIIRVATLAAYPLTDNTEARYAEVAREMLHSGDWIAPQLHGIKFWSKPPLSIWITAATMSLFGQNEFGARVAPLLLSLLTVWLTYFLALKERGRDDAAAAAVVLSSCVLFFVSSGAVMTDAALVAGTTLSMTAFWRAISGRGKAALLWGYLFFVGLAVGLLAKGPVGAVLTFLPIGLWVLWKNHWQTVRTRIPWVSGLLLTAALTLPWYLAAEVRTPGFLDYFLIGEHWRRFTQPGWTGDLYGSAHVQPRGMIWLFWLPAAFPWSLLFLGSWLRNAAKRRRPWDSFRKVDDWTVYIFVWTVSPMLFFTLARNILWTYVLPGLPAFALLAARQWLTASYANLEKSSACRRPGIGWMAGLATPLIFGVLILIWSFAPFKNSQKYLLARYRQLRPNAASRLVYLYDRPYSAEFYSFGKAIKATDGAQIEAYSHDAVQDFFAVKKRFLPGLPEKFKARLVRLGTYDEFLLMGEPGKTLLSNGGPDASNGMAAAFAAAKPVR